MRVSLVSPTLSKIKSYTSFNEGYSPVVCFIKDSDTASFNICCCFFPILEYLAIISTNLFIPTNLFLSFILSINDIGFKGNG